MQRKPRTVLRVRKLRRDREWTLKYAAKRIGLSDGALSLIENGKRQPSLDTAKRIARLYGVPVEALHDSLVVPA